MIFVLSAVAADAARVYIRYITHSGATAQKGRTMAKTQSQAAAMVEKVKRLNSQNLNDEQVTALADSIEYGEVEVSGAHWDGGSAMYEAYHFFADGSIAYLNSDAMQAHTLRKNADKQHAQAAKQSYEAAQNADSNTEEVSDMTQATMTEDVVQDEQEQDATVHLSEEDGSDEALCKNIIDGDLISDMAADLTCDDCRVVAEQQEAADDDSNDESDDSADDSSDDEAPAPKRRGKMHLQQTDDDGNVTTLCNRKNVSDDNLTDDADADNLCSMCSKRNSKPAPEPKASVSGFTDEQMEQIKNTFDDGEFNSDQRGVTFKRVAELTGVTSITMAMKRQMMEAGYHRVNPKTGKPMRQMYYDKELFANVFVFRR